MRIRAFLAINLSVAVTRLIADEQERRKARLATAGARIAWVPPANVHVTLKFLGATEEEAIEAIERRLARGTQPYPPVGARVRGAATGPPPWQPCGVRFGGER